MYINEILLHRAAKGDAHAFEKWVEPYEDGIYRVCLSLTGNVEDARDGVQDTLLKAYRSLNRYRGDAKPQTWLYRIAYNACMDMMRKRRPQESLEAMEENGATFPDPSPGPYQTLEKNERQLVLKKALAALPETYRSVLVLQLQGLSYDEIAQVIDVPSGTVKSRINRAKEKLKELISTDRELFSESSVQVSEGGTTYDK